jgi:hypothetical protein
MMMMMFHTGVRGTKRRGGQDWSQRIVPITAAATCNCALLTGLTFADVHMSSVALVNSNPV